MATSRSKSPTGLAFERHFTKVLQPGSCPSTLFTWTRRHVEIKDGDVLIFSGEVEAPDFWSDLAVTVAAKTWFRKYVHKGETEPRREDSIKTMFLREADAIAEASRYPDVGTDYFSGDETKRTAFRDEIFYIQASQHAMFNTPVHVNVGVATPKHAQAQGMRKLKDGNRGNDPNGSLGAYKDIVNLGPQSSACFIQSIEDTMESLCALQTSETQLFRRSSGTGSNLSALRPANSPLAGGGTASGPVSFMRGLDAWAGVTKSGGSSRRAAIMRVLDVYHPDVRDFISVKAKAQKMIRDLTAAGWDGGFNAIATTWTPYQNANNSVRVDDAFMTAATTGQKVKLHWPTQWGLHVGGDVTQAVKKTKIFGDSVDASSLLDEIAKAAHDCGDPGMQMHSTVNKWHTCKMSGDIVASNPCSEYMFLQDSACNLASLRLTKFLRPDGSFDVAAFSYVARAMFIAQEILVGASSYPTLQIAKNSHDFRPLGLGYCDLGAMLMQLGLPYDSDEGRSVCAAVTALLGGVAYRTSAQIAMYCGGAFAGGKLNKASMLQVIDMHVAAAKAIVDRGSKPLRLFADVAHAGHIAWQQAETLGELHGFRNAQATVLAPTGTIGFAMDCDTTGIEPDTALVKRKKLAGGGTLEYVNQSVAPALRRLGYSDAQVAGITKYIKDTGELPVAYEGHNSDGDRWVKPQHRAVFATAFGQPDNEVSVAGHLKMMAAAQPFLSGAISKTVNCPSHYTVADIREVFVEAWKLGLKAVAVYRDGSKDQPLEAKTKETVTEAVKAEEKPLGHGGVMNKPDLALVGNGDPETVIPLPPPARRRLPTDAPAHRHKFSLGGVDGYVHLGFYSDGGVGEIFVRMEPKAKGQVAVDLATQAASVAIQHGADVSAFLDRWEGTEFAPSGFTSEGELGVAWASSPLDYLAKWLRRFLAARAAGVLVAPQGVVAAAPIAQPPSAPPQPHSANQTRSERCPRCSTAMRRDGACLSCGTCGYGQGGCGG